MIDWRDLEALTDKTVLGMYSERLELIPFAKESPNGAIKPDCDRSCLTLNAVLYWPDEKVAVTVGAGIRTKVEVETARVAISRHEYPELAIRRGDCLRALDRQGQPTLKVGKVTADNRRIIVLDVSSEGVPHEARS